MGVGVYDSNFNERGGCFIVDGPLEGGQDVYNDANVNLIETIGYAAKDIGFDVAKRKGFDGPNAPFDTDFTEIASDNNVAVGWRSWESDFIIGVGPTNSMTEKLDWDADYLLVEQGRGRDAFDEAYGSYVSNVQDYFRLSMLKEGVECRYKTSGYTTSAYSAPEDIDAKIDALKADIAKAQSSFAMSRLDALATIDDKERAAVINTAHETHGYKRHDGRVTFESMVVIPYVDKVAGSIRGYSPQLEECSAETYGICFEGMIPDDIKAVVDAIPGDVVPLPRSPETAAYFARQMLRSESAVYVTAAEFASAVGQEVVVALADLDGDENREAVLAEAPVPAPTQGL